MGTRLKIHLQIDHIESNETHTLCGRNDYHGEHPMTRDLKKVTCGNCKQSISKDFNAERLEEYFKDKNA